MMGEGGVFRIQVSDVGDDDEDDDDDEEKEEERRKGFKIQPKSPPITLITLLIVKASLLCTKNFSVSTLPVSKKFLCKKNTPVSKNSLCKILQHPVLF